MPAQRVLVLAVVISAALTSGCDSTTSQTPRLRINEVMARNRSFELVDVNGAHLDWVEIYNPSPVDSVPLAGYTLTDNLNRPFKFRFPGSRSLAPGGRLVVFLATESDVLDFERPDPVTGEASVFQATDLHADFGLNQNEDDLYLYGNEGAVLVDRIRIHRLPTDMSAGRYPDGADDFGPIHVPTPGQENVEIGLKPATVSVQPRVGQPPNIDDCVDIAMTFQISQDGAMARLPDVMVEVITLEDGECDFMTTGTPTIVEVGAPVAIAEEADDLGCDPDLGGRPQAASTGEAVVIDPDDGCRRNAEGELVSSSTRSLSYVATLPPGVCLETRVLIRVIVDDGLRLTQSRPFCYLYGGEDPPIVISEYQPKNETTAYFLCENCNRDANCCAEDCSVFVGQDCYDDCLKCRDFGELGQRRVLSPDWLEVHNYGDEVLDISLFGLRGRLEDSEDRFVTWQFGPSSDFDPTMTSLEPGGYLVVLADNDGGSAGPRRTYRRLLPTGDGGFEIDLSRVFYSTGFKLNPSRGVPDEVSLQSDSGTEIDHAVLDFREYANEFGLDPEAEEFLADRTAVRLPDENPEIPADATGAERYPPGILQPGIVSDCATFEAPNALDCGNVEPSFPGSQAVAFPRCPSAEGTARLRTQVAADQQASSIAVDVMWTSGGATGRVVGDSVKIELAEDQTSAPGGTSLYDVEAIVDVADSGLVPGDVVEFAFEAIIEMPDGVTLTTALDETIAREASVESVSFRFAIGSRAPTGLLINEVLPHNRSTIIPGANNAAPPDFVEIHLADTAEIDSLDLGGYFVAHQDAPESLSTPILEPRFFRIPDGTVLRRGGFVTLVFGALNDAPAGFVPISGFGLDGCGENVFLIGPDDDGNCLVDTTTWWGGFSASCVEDETGRSSADDLSLGPVCRDGDDILLAVPTPGARNTLDPQIIGVSHWPFIGVGGPNVCLGANDTFVRVEVQFLVDRQLLGLSDGNPIAEAFIELEDGGRFGQEPTNASLPASYPDDFDMPFACRDARTSCHVAFAFQDFVPVTRDITRYRVVVVDSCGTELSPCGEEYCFSFARVGGETQGLRINEINRRSELLGSGGEQTRHWIELHNDSAQLIDLTGMSLSDDPKRPRLTVFPDGTTIEPGGYLLVVTDGQELDPAEGPLPPHVVVDLPWAQVFPRVSRRCRLSGEILLYDTVANGSCRLDHLEFEFPPVGAGPADPGCADDPNCSVCDASSLAREPDGTGEFVLVAEGTPGRANTDFVPVVFLRGDVNRNGGLDISDAVGILNFLFGGSFAPCHDILDTDDSGVVNLTDAPYLLNYLFGSGNPPPAPFPEPGVDPTSDELPCSAESD